MAILALVLAALFVPGLRDAAAIWALVSMLSFVVIALSMGDTSDALWRIVLANVVGSRCLIAAWAIDRWALA